MSKGKGKSCKNMARQNALRAAVNQLRRRDKLEIKAKFKQIEREGKHE